MNPILIGLICFCLVVVIICCWALDNKLTKILNQLFVIENKLREK